MLLRLRDEADSPLYQQIVDQVKAQVAEGTLTKGDRLPSVRDLAHDLEINVNTVYKAYREMESQGVLRMRVGQGATIIAERGDRLRDNDRKRIIREMTEKLRVDAYHLGFTTEYLIELLGQKPREQN